MCGIVGVLGRHEVAPLLVEALRRLEYRGYDSAGIATIRDGRLDRRRAVGKLVELSDLLVRDPLAGKVGIGHTRWATHGAPSVVNAHPHQAGPVAVVHNGIIENYREIREEVSAAGYQTVTQTDTETVALLAQLHLERGMEPVEAARATLARLKGAFALAFLFDGHDDLIVAARRGSPLAIGWGEGEMFLGSDAIALAPLTDRITYLEEGDLAVLSHSGAVIEDARGQRVNRPVRKVLVDATRIEKGGHRHFMAKEIAEQPAVLAAALDHYVRDGRIEMPDVDLSEVERIVLVACGTAHYACLVAKYWIEGLARIPVETDIASEFRYREPPLGDGTLAIFVSQSGETADTLAALRYCRQAGTETDWPDPNTRPAGATAPLPTRIVAVVNVEESSIARDADLVLPIYAGAEIGVASTKAFTCQLVVLALLALKAAQDRGRLDPAALSSHLADLGTLPGLVSHALTSEPVIEDVARRLSEAQDILFLGRGAMYPLALEGALKLKEISYIHAEGYAAGELKHGPIALIDGTVPVVVMAPRDALFEKTVSNMQEVMAREGQIVLITDGDGAGIAGEGAAEIVRMPPVPPLWAPILYAVPAQLLAYHTAIAKGTDVDQPRNLAKSVTVE